LDDLDGLSIQQWKAGTPGLVTSNKLVQTSFKRGHVEQTGEVNGDSFIVYRDAGD
jgi:hypothetical protein